MSLLRFEVMRCDSPNHCQDGVAEKTGARRPGGPSLWERSHMSFLLPDAAGLKHDVLTAFCHFIHFFPSRKDGEAWAQQHAGTFLLSIDEAHNLARLKKHAQYRDGLE